MLYFDNSATTPIDQDVQSLMSDLNQNIYGNPSSIYASTTATRIGATVSISTYKIIIVNRIISANEA